MPLLEGSVVWVGSQTRGPHGIRARRMPGTNNHISRVAKVLLVPISSGLCGSLDHDIAAQGSDPGSGAAVLLGRLLEVATCGECTAVLINVFFACYAAQTFYIDSVPRKMFSK